MKVLIINAILYTSETTEVKKVKTIKDTMIYDLCIAFKNKGHDVSLIAAEEYKPIVEENYPFKIIWLKSYFKKLFITNKIPYNIGIKEIVKNNNFDLIICSEVFSIDTYLAVKYSKSKRNIVIWQEMAFHQKMAKQMASKIWHNLIVKNAYKNIKIVPRTQNAREFIKQYSNNVSDNIISHGINLEKFFISDKKTNSFVICSQLIKRKRIDKSILAFKEYVTLIDSNFILYIIGNGNEKSSLQELVERENLNENVIFTGSLSHKQMIGYLNKAKAMLVYTEKDNSMISIAESLAVATPVITTSIPDNAVTITEGNLGIVNDFWGYNELELIVKENDKYISNCKKYRAYIDNEYHVGQFIDEVIKK
ncbi:glycosyltransferase [Lacrimispora sp.]|uniref:glycosyltransferase family 4 protein n=1 Tax=Lacrimispora sp. TaxID=2719234 RepID=UPI0032E46656